MKPQHANENNSVLLANNIISFNYNMEIYKYTIRLHEQTKTTRPHRRDHHS